MKYFLGFCVFSLVLLNHVFRATCFDSATAPGDIIIGGLFPIHESVNVTQRENGTESRMCDRFSIARLVQSLIMVQVVEEVNKRKEVGNLTLGYWIMDSCSDVTTALLNSLVFMKRSRPIPPPVLAVIGDYYSEISIAVARQLHLEYIPQISYGATSGLLSDKRRFPSFMRTVPEDDHQAQAIVHILQRHNWNWVGVVTTDSDYGRYIVQRFQKHATDKNICFAYTSVIPNDLGHKMLRESISAAVKSITENENATAIVSFARPHHMMYIFDELVKVPQGRGKVWVASDIWSESAGVLRKRPLNDIGKIFGTTLKSGSTTRLNQYLRNLDVNPEHHKNNTFLYKFLKEQEQNMVSSHTSKNVTAAEILRENIHPYAALSVELAVRAVAQAVADLCANRDCKTTKRLDPVELRGALRNATFHLDGKNYSLDSRGDLDTGYDVILWRQTSPTYVNVHYIVAQYHINNDSLTFISQETFKDVISVTGDVISRCSNTCPPGYRKQSAHGQPTCCYECYACPADHFSNSSDSTECHECNVSTHYSFRGSDRCIRKTIVFLHWKDVYHHVLQAFTALGALLTIAVGIIFLARWNTPVVRACVGPICILLLISLLGTFVSVIIFGGKPNNMQCQARQGLFALSFTLCVSCILVKSFKIILAFEFDPSVQRVLRKLYKPYIIIATCMAGQVLICALWFSLKPPERIWVVLKKKDELLLTCYETSFPAFGAMLGYIGFLALICFGVAFKGRNLPESYNDAKFITFAMLIYFICWVIFGPVYVNVSGPYRQAVQMVVILISAYGILFCQFGVKCYIILFNQEANTVDAFRQDVRNYTMNEIEGKDGKWDSFSVSSGGIQNTTLDLESSLWSSEQSINQIKSKSSDLSINAFSASNSGLFTLQQDRSKRQIRRYFSLQE